VGRHGRSLSGLGAKPHELQPVGEKKLTESDPQLLQHPVHNRNFKISTSECIGYALHQNAPFRE